MSYLKALLKILLIAFLLFVGASSFYVYAYGDDVKAFLVKEINKQLLIQAEVEEVEISIWKSFPNLSLVLHRTKLLNEGEVFVSAEELLVKFSLFDLIDKNYSMHAIEVRNGSLHLKEDAKGNYFPMIWKKETTESSDDFDLELRKVSLLNVDLLYEQRNQEIGFQLTLKSAWAKGNFGTEQYDLAWNSEIVSFDYQIKGESQVQTKDIRLEAICSIQNQKKRLEIDQLSVNWQALQFTADGSLDYSEKVIANIQLRKEEGSLKSLYPLLKQDDQKSLDSLDPSGQISMDAKLTGELSPSFHAALSLNFQLNRASLTIDEPNIKLKEIEVLGSYENSDLSDSKKGLIRLDSITALVNNCLFNGKSYWSSTTGADIYLDGKLEGELVNFNSLLEEPMAFKQGKFQAELDLQLPFDINSKNWSKAWKQNDNSVYVQLNDAELIIDKSHQISSMDIEAAVGKNDLFTKKASLTYNDFPIEFEGSLYNLLSFLEDKEEKLVVDGSARGKRINFEELLALFDQEAEGEQRSEEKKIQLYLNCSLDELTYKKLSIKEPRFYLRYYQGQLEISDIQLRSLGGSAVGRVIYDSRDKYDLLQVESDFSQIDIHQLFLDMEDFDQTAIQAKNLEGRASGIVNLELNLDEKGEVVKPSILLNGFLDIENGRLLNYEPLYKLSKYIELEELKEIKFSRLQNQIKIANEEVIIPRFEVKSSALDLEMEGSHQFNNEVDYRFSLLLSQVLGKKAKKPKDSEFGYVEDDGLGKTRLFLRMTGDIDDPDIRYDQEQLGKHLKKEVKDEKREIKSILKEEFGLFKKDTTLKSPSRKEKNDRPLFQIEWGEDSLKGTTEQPDEREEEQKKSKKKGKFGKFIDKIAKPNEEEYVNPQE